jgi:hypothetical protein
MRTADGRGLFAATGDQLGGTAAKELKKVCEQNARLKRLLAEAERETDPLREVAKDAPIDVKC